MQMHRNRNDLKIYIKFCYRYRYRREREKCRYTKNTFTFCLFFIIIIYIVFTILDYLLREKVKLRDILQPVKKPKKMCMWVEQHPNFLTSIYIILNMHNIYIYIERER